MDFVIFSDGNGKGITDGYVKDEEEEIRMKMETRIAEIEIIAEELSERAKILSENYNETLTQQQKQAVIDQYDKIISICDKILEIYDSIPS